VRWFVIGRDGQKYGPADLATLQKWVNENRISPDMMLEEEATGRRVRADMLPGLQFGGTGGAATTIASPSPTTQDTSSGGGSGAPGAGFPSASPSPWSAGPQETKYWVIGPDGQRYGPADLAKLREWAAEGRIGPATMLEDYGTGQFVRATAVPGLVLPQAQAQNPWAQAPGSPYPRQPSGYYAPSPSASNDLTWAWVLSILGFLCCLPLAFVGLYYADRAKKAGIPGGQAAFVVSLILVILGLLLWLLNILFLGFAPAAFN
jgi:hypothetical protein